MSDLKPCPLEPTLTITIHKELIKLCGNRSTAIEDALRAELETVKADRDRFKWDLAESKAAVKHITADFSDVSRELDAAKARIAELEAENAALTAERDHARQDAATVRLQLAETQRPFTVIVEVPEIELGICPSACPISDEYIGCREGFSIGNEPGPGCPRYPKPEAESNG